MNGRKINMLNAEKNKKVILDLTEGGYYFAVRKDGQNIARSCDGLNCEDCIFDEEEDCGCSFSRMKWMLSEYKEPVKLARFEHDVLKYLLEKTQYRFIVRERNDTIYIYKRKPKKGSDAWEIISGMRNFNLFINLFPFIKWEDSEPTSIEYVLNNCEVVNDAKE